MSRRDRNRRIMVGGVILLFILSSFGFSLFSAPHSEGDAQGGGATEFDGIPPTDGPFVPEFPAQTIFTEPVDEAVQVNVLIPYGSRTHPDIYPDIPVERKLGNAWLLYNCEDCDDAIAQMQSLVRDYRGRVYMAPYPKLTSSFAVTTFQNRKNMDKFNRTEVETFICETIIRTPDVCALRFI